MQQESTKKSKKLIWLIAALAALLVVVGVVLAIFLMPGNDAGAAEPTGPVGGRPELYWNVDRETYLGNAESAGLSTREPGEDGLYHLRFAYNGELVEYTVADKRLVNVIDNNQILGLVFDDNGAVIDAINPTTFATEVAKDFMVQRIQSDSIYLNSSIAMNGMEMPVKLCELTQIYDVRNDAPVIGAIAEPELMDKVIVYANDKGEVTHIYIVDRQPTGIVGWRVDKKQFDSKTQHSTRKPDENGIWHITISVDGKHEVFKCKDQAIVDDIDKRGTYVADLAIRLDEDGYICEVMEPSVALRGKLAGASYHITSLDGNQFTATRLLSGKDTGKTFSGTITENTKIFNVCYGGTNTYIGEPTQLQNMDRVIAYTDLEGNPLVIFVTFRMVDAPVAYSRVRMYDAAKLETTRTPVNGYYVFEVAIEGKVRTVRTKDKALATMIDSYSSQLVALKLNGDIIEAVYDVHRVCGDDTYGAGGRRFVVDQTGVILSWVTVGYDFNAPTNLVMKPDVQIYDVTGYPGSKFGAPTELQIGDMVRPMVDYNTNITHLFVVSRCSNEPLYYNLSRKYDSVKAESTRVPDEDGYYVFSMASRGKQVTVKTKSKEMADFMDMQYAPVMSLKVDKNGIVKMAYPADSAYKFGYKTANWNWFVKYNDDGTITTKSYARTVDYNLKVADDVKIYNVSSIYDKNRGEATKKLMPNDLIQAVAVNDTKEIKEIYVITRQLESKFYYNILRKYNTVTKETTRVPDEEGYYVFDLSVEGKTKQFKTKDKAIATTIDSYGYVPFGMQVSGNTIKRAFSAGSIYGVKATAASNYDVTKIKGNDATLTCYLPTSASVGDQIDIKLADNYKAYNVSSYAEPFGAKTKLGLGDRAIYYTNMDGEVEWVYIWYKNTHQKGHISYCEHCDKKVYWQPYTGAAYATDAHVYVTNDRTVSQANISSKEVELKDRPELVVDLNGKTMKATGRAFLTYGTLSIVDTVGGGKIVGGNTATKTEQALMSSTGGVINLYSGTITRNPDNKACSNGGVVFVGADSTFNMYGGTIEGGYATAKGGNVYNAYGQFNMYGGKITGGLNGAGKNVFIGEGGFYMDGGVIDGDMFVESAKANVVIGGNAKINKGSDAGLQLAGGAQLNLDKVTADTQVVVDACGVFTKEYSNINSYLANFTSSDANFPVFVQGKALAGGKYAFCEHCDDYAYWGKFSTGACSGKTHLVMTEDVVMSNQLQIGTSSVKTDDVVIDLNGHTVTTETGTNKAHDTGRFALVYATLSIMDNSAEGTGKIVAAQAYNTGGVVMVATGGHLNLYGGELTLADDCAGTKGGIVSVGSGTMDMYGGKLTNGRVKASATSTSAYVLGGSVSVGAGTFNMYGGEIVGGSELNPDDKILLGGNICVQGGKVNVYGGTVSGGVADLGGNIFADDKSVVNILGGEIKDGRAVVTIEENFNGETGVTTTTITCGNGGNIYADQSSVITIGADEGDVQTLVTGGEARQGGNIYQITKSTVNIGKLATVSGGKAVAVDAADEKYNGGNIYLGESANLTIKGLMTGGHAWQGGNIAANGLSTVTIDGGTVSDGTIDGWSGGNIQSNNGVVKLMNKATVSGGKANRYRGGNIYAGGGAEVYISDSTISGGSAWQGGNIFISSRTYTSGSETKCDYGILEVTDGAVITGGIAHITDNYSGGGNICAMGAKITVEGATIENGISKSCGGNIFITNTENQAAYTSTLTMDQDAKVLGGDSQKTSGYNGGGNIYAAGNTVIECAGTIADGKAGRYGGNLMLSHASVTLQDGAKVENGTATAVSGGNICKFNSGSVDILAGATVSGGTAGASAGSIFISGDSGNGILNVAGTITGGEVLVYNSKVDMTVSGDAKIDELTINAGAKINVGEMTENAMVKVNANGIFTNPFEKASQYAKYFDAVSDEMDVVANDANELVVGNMRYCEHCGEEVMFGSFATGTISESTHMILTEDVTLDTQLTIGSSTNKDIEVVVDLNGYTVASNPAATNNYKRFALVYAKLFIQDSSAEETGKIVAVPTTENAGAIMVGSTGQVTLYSGEITIAEGTAARKSAGVISVGSGKFTMNGGKISGGVVTDHASDLNYTANMGGAVYVTYGTFTMNGGEIVGGESAANATKPLHGGAIYNASGSVTINGGTVNGGKAALGGAIYTSSTLTINGGTVSGGEAVPTVSGTTVTDGLGGNIYVAENAKVTIGKDDGDVKATVTGGKAYMGGNIYVADTKNTVTIGKNGIVEKGETAPAVEGNEKYSGGNVYMFEGTKITVKGTVTDGHAWQGGNINANGLTTLTIDGGTVSNGTIDGWNGGNIASANGVVRLQNKATVSNGKATRYRGGNIYLGGGAELYVSDSTVSGGQAWQGGNIFATGRTYTSGTENKYDYAIVEITNGAVITGGTTNITDERQGGGNICALGAKVTIKGSTVENGVAKSCGGNIMLGDFTSTAMTVASTLNVDATSEIKGGQAKKDAGQNGGGNIFASGSTEMTISGTVSDGVSSRWGGNVMLYEASSLTLTDGAVVENGKSSSLAGNIMAFGSGNLNIQGGAKLKGGTAIGSTTKYGSAIYASMSNKLNIAGEVENCITVDSSAGAKLTVSGAAKIHQLELPDDAKFDLVLDNLTEGASIKVNTNGVFTVANDKAAEYAGYFSSVDAAKNIAVVGNTLYMGTDVKACPHCNGKNAVWVPFSRTIPNGTTHMILTKDLTTEDMPSQIQVGSCKNHGTETAACNHNVDLVVDLAGYDVTIADATAEINYTRFALVYGTLSIMDSSAKETGTITATSTANGGAILLGTGGKLNLYGGELTHSGSATKSGGLVSVGGGEFNMFGGKLTGGKLVNSTATYDNNMGGSVYVTTGTFKMSGGEIIGGKAGAEGQKNLLGGNIYVAGGTVEITGGTISGGKAYNGGNIYVKDSGTVKIGSGVVISGGESTATSGYAGGGNIYGTGNAAIECAGNITDGRTTRYGGNILLSNADMILASGAAVSGGKSGVEGVYAGGNICRWNNGTLDIQAGASVTGGTEKNGAASDVYANNSAKGTAALNIAGTVGTVRVDDKYVPVTVSGAAEVDNLSMASSARVTLGELTTGASIGVTATGVFTNESDKAEAYLNANYFSAVDTAKKIVLDGKTLSVVAK